MIEMNHKRLSLRAQCRLLDVNRNRLTPKQNKQTSEDELIMRTLDEIHTAYPFYGQRNLQHTLLSYGWKIGRKRVRRLMKLMDISSLAPQPNTSRPKKEHKKYPYLLRNLTIDRADQVWCADITYLPMQKGHAYLVAIMDWHTRAVLSWEVSNTMDSSFCVRALKTAMLRTGRKPEIFNTDQGSQFTGDDWIKTLKENSIKVSMDGKGRWMDNVFIERLWRSLKYERIRLYSYTNVRELSEHVDTWMKFYNHTRPHQSMNMKTPMSLYNPPSKVA